MPATSKEHVPPLCLFPEKKDLEPGLELRKNLITVPSCETHNQKKSGDDEYLLYALTMNIVNNETAMTQIQRKIVRAITRNRSRFDEFSKENRPVFAADSNGTMFNTLMVRMDNERFLKLLRWIAKGLYFNEFGKNFSGKCTVLPDFTIFAGSKEDVRYNDIQSGAVALVRPHFDELAHKGENPEVFRYCFMGPDEKQQVAMRMCFFGGSNVYAAFAYR